MIKEALQFLAGIQTPQRPVTVKVGTADYAVEADGTLGDVIPEPPPEYYPPTFTVTSLSSIAALYTRAVDYLKPENTAVHIVDPFTVRLVSLFSDPYGHRQVYAEAKHPSELGLLSFSFNRYYDPEGFLLAFRAAFLFDENAMLIQRLCSTLSSSNSIGVADDGISQQIIITEGAITRASTTLPSDGVPLILVRTFREANPVQSKFLLRMKSVKDALPQIALFEIDTRWKLDTILSIRHFLETQLPDTAVILS